MVESKISLRYVPIFFELEDDDLKLMENAGIIRRFQKNMVILDESSDESSGLFIITKGSVKVTRNDSKGNEIILAILNEFDYFGEMSLLDGQPPSANVLATENTEVFFIGRDQFMQLIQSHPRIMASLLDEVIKRLRAADDKIKSLSLNKAKEKIISAVIQLAEISGVRKHGSVELNLPFQHEIANMAGTSRETVSRVLHALHKKGLVELEGSIIRIPEYDDFKKIHT